MKKVLLFALLVMLVPLAVQAEGAIGPAVYYRQPVWFDNPPDFSNAAVGDFMFGLDGVYDLSALRIEGLALVTPASEVLLDAYLMGGLVLNLQVIRLYAELGPHLGYNFAAQDLNTTLGAKAGVDLVLGTVSIGVSYLGDLNVRNGVKIGTDTGYLGVSLLFGW